MDVSIRNTLRAGAEYLSLKPVMAAVLVVGLTACTDPMTFPVSEAGQAEYEDGKVNIVPITPKNIALYSTPVEATRRRTALNPPRDPRPYTYRLGVGDELRISVWTDPERTQASGETGAASGPVVDENGNFFYPFVGSVKARGRTINEIRTELSTQLQKFITDPQIDVAVSSFNAHTATITGEVSNAGPAALTNIPKRLLDVVNAAGTSTQADLSKISIQRGKTRHLVDLRSFVRKGHSRHNPIVLPNDLIHVPLREDNKIFTFGEIRTGEIELGDTRKSLTEVLASSGGIDRLRADARGVFVFRRTDDSPEGFDVYQFNLRMAEVLVLTTDFTMAPLDIVFVTNDPITRWNDTVGKLLSPLTGIVRAQAVTEKLAQ
jgi:polysaccharide export outer membrane protein